MQLTAEQLEKAKKAYERVLQRKGHNLCAHNEEALTASFAAVEPPQVDVPVDLVERMRKAYCDYAIEHLGWNPDNGPASRANTDALLRAALRVALDDPRVLGKVSDDEWETIVRLERIHAKGFWREDFDQEFLASRRARLLQPVRVEERVTITLQEGDFPYVVSVDGKKISAFGYEHSRDGSGAADFRRSLIAKMKAEGTISHETGGNAQ